MTEKKLQAEIIKFLQSKGAYVLKNDASYRQGVPDLSFWRPDLTGFIEVKAHENSPFQPLQELTMKKIKDMSIFCEVIHNENWVEWQAKFDQWLEG
jgi:Holliday junction resolvase-like predicted endonuclease